MSGRLDETTGCCVVELDMSLLLPSAAPPVTLLRLTGRSICANGNIVPRDCCSTALENASKPPICPDFALGSDETLFESPAVVVTAG